MKRYFAFIVVCCAVCFICRHAAAAVTGELSGTVLDFAKWEPVRNAVIRLDNGRTTQTDNRGFFHFLGLTAKTYDVSNEKEGFRRIVLKKVPIRPGSTLPVNVQLYKAKANEPDSLCYDYPVFYPDYFSVRNELTADEIEFLPAYYLSEPRKFKMISPAQSRPSDYENYSATAPRIGSYRRSVVEYADFNMSSIENQNRSDYIFLKEGGDSFQGSLEYTTNDIGSSNFQRNLGHSFPQETDSSYPRTYETIYQPDQLRYLQAQISGPVPFVNKFLNPEQKLSYVLSGEVYNSDGMLPNEYKKTFHGFGSLCFYPSPNQRLYISGFAEKNEYSIYDVLWKKDVSEDLNENYKSFGDWNNDGVEDNPAYIVDPVTGIPWYGNGVLDTEDKNGNNLLDEGEDINGNGILDMEDLDYNNKLDVFHMPDRVPRFESRKNQLHLDWMYVLHPRLLAELSYNFDSYSRDGNVNETTYEDIDGDGKLDMVSENIDVNGDGAIDYYEWKDLDGDGYFDKIPEDMNGNGILDPRGTDLFTDYNQNGYVDASEYRPRQYWITMLDAHLKGCKSADGFYTADRTTYYTVYWDHATLKKHFANFSLTWQMIKCKEKQNQLKFGTQGGYLERKDYRVTRYGAGKNSFYPHYRSFYIQNIFRNSLPGKGKNFVLNLGLRYDIYDPNYEITQPKYDMHNSPLETIIYPVRKYWLPRLGLSFMPTYHTMVYYNFEKFLNIWPSDNPGSQIPVFSVTRDVLWSMDKLSYLEFGIPSSIDRISSKELGFSFQCSQKLKFDTALFYRKYLSAKKINDIYFLSLHGYCIAENCKTKFKGINTSVKYSPYPNMHFLLKYVYSKAYYIWKYWPENPTADEDRPHRFSSYINYSVPKNKKRFLNLFSGVSATLCANYFSGLPYSPPRGQDKMYVVNNEQLPGLHWYDLKVQKKISCAGISVEFYSEVHNIFNKLLLTDLPDDAEEWYTAFKDTNEYAAMGKYEDPSIYAPGRRIYFGIKTSW